MFDRATGKPIWRIEEKPVTKGDMPGEWYSPTQPFPTKPPAYDRQGVSIDDLIDFTPELRAEAVKLVSRYKLGPMFDPPVVSKLEGPLAMRTHILYVFSQTNVSALGLVPPPNDPKFWEDLGKRFDKAAHGLRARRASSLYSS